LEIGGLDGTVQLPTEQSVAIKNKSNQWPSGTVSGYPKRKHWQSVAISGHQERSVAIRNARLHLRQLRVLALNRVLELLLLLKLSTKDAELRLDLLLLRLGAGRL
jgi:hypothetical protein